MNTVLMNLFVKYMEKQGRDKVTVHALHER